MRVSVLHDDQFFTHGDLNAQFLAHLAAQSVGQRLAILTFAAGEFPQPAEHIFLTAARHEHASIFADGDRGDYIIVRDGFAGPWYGERLRLP